MKRFVFVLALSVAPFAVHAEEADPSVEQVGFDRVAFALDPSADTSRRVSSLMRLARHLESEPGVSTVEVRLSKSDVLVRYDPGATGVPSLVTAVEALGFHARSKQQAELARAK